MKSLRQTTATERDTLKAIMDWLDLQQAQGRLLWIRHSPSNVVGKKGQARFRRPRQSQLGAADIFVFSHKQIFCIEVKSFIGELSKDQHRWAKLALAQGIRYMVARSVEEVMEVLK